MNQRDKRTDTQPPSDTNLSHSINSGIIVEKVQPTYSPKNWKTIIISGSLIILMIIGGVLSYFIFKDKGEQSSSSQDISQETSQEQRTLSTENIDQIYEQLSTGMAKSDVSKLVSDEHAVCEDDNQGSLKMTCRYTAVNNKDVVLLLTFDKDQKLLNKQIKKTENTQLSEDNDEDANTRDNHSSEESQIEDTTEPQETKQDSSENDTSNDPQDNKDVQPVPSMAFKTLNHIESEDGEYSKDFSVKVPKGWAVNTSSTGYTYTSDYSSYQGTVTVFALPMSGAVQTHYGSSEAFMESKKNQATSMVQNHQIESSDTSTNGDRITLRLQVSGTTEGDKVVQYYVGFYDEGEDIDYGSWFILDEHLWNENKTEIKQAAESIISFN